MPSPNLIVLLCWRTHTLTITKTAKYKGNQITQLDAEPKDNKGKKGIWHNKGKVQTEGVVAKGTYSTSYTPKVTEDRKVGA